MKILRDDPSVGKNSPSCKDDFVKEYGEITEVLLNQLFEKNFLEKKRENIPELNELIRLME